MDIDFMKTDQMEMMLMQMDKLPDFAAAYGGADQLPMPDFSLPCSDEAFNMNVHHQMSFSGGVHQEAAPPAAAFVQQQGEGQRRNSMAAMREMIFRIAAMQPIHIDPESVKPPKRRNVKISTDPQSVAARHRRERISERIRILQRLVPGGTKMDTASMLDEAIHYVKFLKNQVQSLERVAASRPAAAGGMGFPVPMTSGSYFPVGGKGIIRGSIVSPAAQHLADV